MYTKLNPHVCPLSDQTILGHVIILCGHFTMTGNCIHAAEFQVMLLWPQDIREEKRATKSCGPNDTLYKRLLQKP